LPGFGQIILSVLWVSTVVCPIFTSHCPFSTPNLIRYLSVIGSPYLRSLDSSQVRESILQFALIASIMN
jgi:hypothetical protein